MSTSPTRKAKYCPRCGTMTFPDTVQCASCGHRFHTGVEEQAAPDVPKHADDGIHKTMMFDMPPSLSARPPSASAIQEPLSPLPVQEKARRPVWAIVLGVLAVLSGVCVVVWAHSLAPPLGSWTLQGTGNGGAVGLTLTAGGVGRLEWTGTQAGSVPLRWQVDKQRRLSLSAAGQMPSDPTAARSVEVLTERAWPYVRKGDELVLGGSLVFRQADQAPSSSR